MLPQSLGEGEGGGGGGSKKEKGKGEKETPATKGASFAFRSLFQLSQQSLQRPIRNLRALFAWLTSRGDVSPKAVS